MSLKDELVAGAIGGLAGGLVMTAFMAGATKAGIIEETLPHKVEQYAEEQFDRQEFIGSEREEVVAQGGHLAFSTLLGALYGAFHYSSPDLPVLPTGPLYGLGVYAVSLAGIGPQLGITKGPREEEPTTVMRRVMMHAVFGTVTATVAEKVLDSRITRSDGKRMRRMERMPRRYSGRPHRESEWR